MELLDPFVSPHLMPADRPPGGVPGRREYLIAGAGWLLAGVAAWLTVRRSGLPAWDDFVFFVMLTVIAVWLSAGLPLGVHVARIATPVAVAAIALGAGQALVISLAGGLLAIGGLVLLKRWFGVSQRSNAELIVAGLWSSAATGLALLPACWLYAALGGDFSSVLSGLSEIGRYALFATTYFLAWVLMLALWLMVSGVGVRTYLGRSWRAILINGYLPLGVGPLIVLAYDTWPHLRLLILILYAIGGLLTYGINQAYLSLVSYTNKLRTLNRIGLALSASLDLDKLLEAIRLGIGELLDVSGFYLALYDEQTQMVTFPVAYEAGEVVTVEPHVFANGVTEHVIRTRQPLLLTHDVVQQAKRLGLEPRGRTPRSYVGVPILSGDRVIGMLGLRDYAREHAYRPSDVPWLETVASQAGAALSNAQLFQHSQRQASELSSLHRISLKSSSSLELRDVLRAICQEVVSTMGLSKVAIFLVDEETQTMNLVEGVGLSERFRAAAVGIDVRESYRAEVIRTGEPLVVEDLRSHPLYPQLTHAAEEGVLALIDLPLRRAERVIGALTAYYPQPHVFSPHEIELMQTLAGQVAIAVENAQLFEATRARTRDLETLYEASTAINASLSLKNVLVAVGTSMLQALHTRSCLALIALEDRQTFRVELRLVAGEGDTILEDTSLRLNVHLGEMPNIGMAKELQRPVVLGPLSAVLGEGERILLDECGVQAALAVPLFVRGEMIGLIVTGSPDEERMFPAGPDATGGSAGQPGRRRHRQRHAVRAGGRGAEAAVGRAGLAGADLAAHDAPPRPGRRDRAGDAGGGHGDRGRVL